MAAPELKDAGVALPSIIGTELWAGESSLAAIRELDGAWFATVSDSRMDGFRRSYETRFGEAPNRLAPMGYDAVLLTLRIAREWRPGQPFPVSRLIDSGGFLGVDGPFRFLSDGTSQRALEVRQVGNGRVDIVDAAPASFSAAN
jgi:hypothetical protein